MLLVSSSLFLMTHWRWLLHFSRSFLSLIFVSFMWWFLIVNSFEFISCSLFYSLNFFTLLESSAIIWFMQRVSLISHLIEWRVYSVLHLNMLRAVWAVCKRTWLSRTVYRMWNISLFMFWLIRSSPLVWSSIAWFYLFDCWICIYIYAFCYWRSTTSFFIWIICSNRCSRAFFIPSSFYMFLSFYFFMHST